MIEIRELSRRYGNICALDCISLTIGEGSTVGLLGQNGAGKTTLLNIMTGFLAPSEGSVLINGYDPLLQPAEAKRLIGYLPEQPPLYDEMTVTEYLSFAAALRGVKKKAIPDHVDEILYLTRLTEVRTRLIAKLSKGYRQRVGIAQALCGDPELLILDEPTVGLDPKQVTEIRQLIQSLSKDRTIILSSHILSEVQQLCDHVVILERGQVKLDSAMQDIGKDGQITVLCTFASGPDIRERIRKMEGVTGVRLQPGSDGGHTALAVTFEDEQEPERRLFHLASSLNQPILHMSRVESTLEQVFLKVISG